MDALIEKLDHKRRGWKPDTADAVRSCIAEIIEMADNDVLDLSRSRIRGQEVFNSIDDEPASR
ncbi:MAG TPA: hypothetical protein VEX68_19820 [Bryobacteraceae bacterium]|nr:hypothetical protein [Bryobacteraceae bacterium]